MTPLLCIGARKMGCRANISDAGAEGRTEAGAQFYGRSPGDKLVI